MNVNLETPQQEPFVALDVAGAKPEDKPEEKPSDDPFNKSKNLELAPLKNSKENNNASGVLSQEVRAGAPQNATMWKKKPQTESRIVGSSNNLPPGSSSSKFRYQYKILQKKLLIFLDHYYFVGFMTLITLYALFGDDIRVLTTDRDGDQYFFGISSCCLGFFAIEIILSCIAKEGYFLGFFFWLDVISTASLIFDIQWITDQMFGAGGGQSAQSATSLARASRASRVGTRAGRIVRIVRLIRLVKLYKHAHQVLLDKKNLQFKEEEVLAEAVDREKDHQATATVVERRDSKLHLANPGMDKKESKKKIEGTLISASNIQRQRSDVRDKQEVFGEKIRRQFTSNNDQIYKNQNANSGSGPVGSSKELGGRLEGNLNSKSKELGERSGGPATTNAPMEIKDGLLNNIPKETNVGKKLSDLTTKRVIMLVMSIMLSIPIFSLDTYTDEYTSYESGLKTMWIWYGNKSSPAFVISSNTYISENTNSAQRNPLILLQFNSDTVYQSPTINSDYLRLEEKNIYTYSPSSSMTIVAIYDGRADNNLDAALGIGRTIFVCVVLTMGALYFSKDAHDLVLHPIENMLEKVKRIAKNPLEAAQMEENEALALEEINKKGTPGTAKKEKKKEENTYETTILEKTIIKIGALLALGFGEAGSEIIAQNMSKSGEVDPMIPGKKIMAIFGFCDIRNFTDATEILQEDVMVFVNEIAEIVHSLVDHFSGAANKNIGDAFLLVWKFDEKEVKQDPNNPSILVLSENRSVKQIADMSVISFIKIIAGINLSKKLKKYKEHKGLNERMPNYCVRMGFGLHIGWAIEGAIGSEFKIDASYLSPNVNMASRLEAATKQFGVPILISGALYKTMTEDSKKLMRHIDRVTVKGSIEPMDLYTCDLDIQNLLAKVKVSQLDKYGSQKMTKAEKKKLKVYNRLRRNELKKNVMENKTTVANLFQSDKELRAMRETFPRDFFETFEQGLNKYFSGEWPECREILEKTYTMLPFMKDGPSNTLLEVIKENGGKAPSNWMGYRELTEK